MKIPFYQTKWFNISLQGLAKKIGHKYEKVADSKIYHHLYKQLMTNYSSLITEDWIQKKHNLSNWLYKFLLKNKLDKGAILSVGCGLGVVEQPLIDKDLKIDLQECQDISIQYLAHMNIDTYKKANFLLSQDLGEIKGSSYDSVLSITSTYCLNNHEIKSFLSDINRIIKPKGIFIWYETSLSLNDFFQYIKNRLLFRKSEGILWGWKRSINSFVNFAKENNLYVKNIYFFDKDNNEVKINNIFGLVKNPNIAWQMVVFQKYD